MRGFPWGRIRAADRLAKEKKARNRAYYAANAGKFRRYAAERRAAEAESRRALAEATVARVAALVAAGTATEPDIQAGRLAEQRIRLSDAQRARRLREVVG